MSAHILRFRPILKRLIWGGRRLGDMLGKPIGNETDYAESWEIVDHGADQSIVAEGLHEGLSLSDLVTTHRSWLLGPDSGHNQFPLLLKFLDCSRVLSVQVHPNDAYGRTLSVPDRGKTEAWYVLHAEPESVIYAGLKAHVTRQDFEEAVKEDRVESVLHRFQTRVGDCVFIPAGTVHALGGGLVIAEIQQSSDTTFRIHDWNRLDASGKPRPLHLEQAMEVINFSDGPVDPIRNSTEASGWQSLVECDKFTMKALNHHEAVLGGDGRCHIVTVAQGIVTLKSEIQQLKLAIGETALVPAASSSWTCLPDPNSTLLAMSPNES